VNAGWLEKLKEQAFLINARWFEKKLKEQVLEVKACWFQNLLVCCVCVCVCMSEELNRKLEKISGLHGQIPVSANPLKAL
jgi:hypothetical protein